MRKIEQRVVSAFVKRQPETFRNTSSDGVSLRLWGNEIAKWHEDGGLWITTAGWNSKTSASRLNALFEMIGFHWRIRVTNRDCVWVDKAGNFKRKVFSGWTGIEQLKNQELQEVPIENPTPSQAV